MAGKDTNGLNGRFPGSMRFREAPQQPGLLFMVVCDDPATDASVPTSSSGRVERQPYQAGQAFAILGGVPPREFLMYGTPRGRRTTRRYCARNSVFVEFPHSPSDKA